MFAEVHRFYRLARLLVTTCGKNALKGSLPLYLTLAITVFVLFAGNGLDARTITSLGVERPVFRWCLGLAWVLASLPAARALLSSSETFFLRALPVPRAELLLLFGAALAIVHLPWTVLWARGAGAGPALGATLGVLAIQMHVLAGARTRVDGLTLAVGIAAFALAPSLLTAALGVGSFVAGLGQAWSRAPESQPFGSHCVSTRSRPLALMSALAISVVRGQRPVVVRAFLLALTACVLNVLGLRNNGVSEPAAIIRIPRGLGACLCLWCCRHWGRRSQGRGQSSLGVGRLWRLPCAPLQLCGCAACRLVSGLRSRVRRAGRSDLGARRATGGPAGPAHGERRRCLGSGLDRNRPLGDAQRRPRRRPFAARGLLPVRPFGGPACPPNFSCRWSVADGCRSAERAFGSGTLGRGAPVSRRLAFVLTLSDVHKTLGGAPVLAGVNLTAAPSDIVVVSGPNGAGKSTLLRVMCGLLDANRGEVSICGHSLRREPRKAKGMLGYVPDGLEALPDLLASELVALVRTLKPGPDGGPASLDEEWKERLGVTALWNQRVGALSFGQRKRVALLAALCGSPWLLLLDEPTNGLDAQGVALLRQLLAQRRQAQRVTVLSTNDPGFSSAIPGRHCRLEHGRLVQLPPAPVPDRPPS